MKTTILFITEFDGVSNIANFKKEAISFFGHRMIENEMDGYPAIILNNCLTEHDRKFLISSCENLRILPMIVESDNESFLCQSYPLVDLYQKDITKIDKPTSMRC